MGGRKGVERFSRARLVEARQAAGLTQWGLDAAARLPRGSVAQYESVREPTTGALSALATALGVDFDDLREPSDQAGPWLSDLRMRHTRLTQAQLAARAGLSRSTYRAIERGEHGNPTPEQTARIAAALTTDETAVSAGEVLAAYALARRCYVESLDGY